MKTIATSHNSVIICTSFTCAIALIVFSPLNQSRHHIIDACARLKIAQFKQALVLYESQWLSCLVNFGPTVEVNVIFPRAGQGGNISYP